MSEIKLFSLFDSCRMVLKKNLCRCVGLCMCCGRFKVDELIAQGHLAPKFKDLVLNVRDIKPIYSKVVVDTHISNFASCYRLDDLFPVCTHLSDLAARSHRNDSTCMICSLSRDLLTDMSFNKPVFAGLFDFLRKMRERPPR